MAVSVLVVFYIAVCQAGMAGMAVAQDNAGIVAEWRAAAAAVLVVIPGLVVLVQSTTLRVGAFQVRAVVVVAAAQALTLVALVE